MNNYLNLKKTNAKKIALQVLLGDNSIQTMPQWVAFTTTTFCNLKCPHCQTHGTEETRALYNSQHWDRELTLRVAEETLPAAIGYWLTLNGEPLATPYLLELIARMRPYGAKMQLVTNGTLMSKKVLIQVLPLVSAVHISIDGGTKDVVETIRSGVKFEKLLNRVRVLTRSAELLGDILTFPIRFTFTVMGSNIRDMPEAVRLAHALKVQGVDYGPLIVFDSSVADEANDLYAPQYKAYYQRAKEEARRLGISINSAHPEYIDVFADPDFPADGRNMLVNLPADYYDTLPSPESYLDMESIELEAAEIADSVRDGMPPVSAQPPDDFAEFLQTYDKQLRELGQDADTEIPWCSELETKAFITTGGEVVPCCIPGRPCFGNIHEESVTQIWNGPERAAFWQSFHSSSPPECCKDCRYRVFVSRRSLLKQVLPESILTRFLRILK